MILTNLKQKMGRTRFVRRALEKPVDFMLLKKRPSIRFFVGLGIIALSYLLAWPLIGLLGAIAVRRHRPEIFALGSPIAYGISTLVFLAGIWLAGKDALAYMRASGRLLVHRFFRKDEVQTAPDDQALDDADKIKNNR